MGNELTGKFRKESTVALKVAQFAGKGNFRVALGLGPILNLFPLLQV